jgi:hypothetical protein
VNLDCDQLRTILEAKLAAHKAAWEKENAAALDRDRAAAELWVEVMGPRWIDSLAKMTKAIKAGKPITKEMAPPDHGWEERARFFSPERRKHNDMYVPPSDLIGLLAMVNICTDSSVNVSKLGGKNVLDALSRY